MRAKVLLLVSCVVNVALGLALMRLVQFFQPRRGAGESAGLVVINTNAIRVAKTNILFAPRLLTWSDLESTNYEAYIANLRAIGCPRSVIRDLIVADINQLYVRKRRELNVTTNDLKWWLSEPDEAEQRAALARAQALEDERRTLLTRLLGPNWAPPGEADEPAPVPLTGPVLGDLPAETKQAVQDLSVRSQQRVRDYIQERQRLGEPPDPLELAQLRELTRQELEEVLSPDQLEEYLLRFSANAGQLRGELRGLNATPDEFRQLFRATDAIDRQLQLLGVDDEPALAQRRTELEQLREAAIKEALSPERYATYRMLRDPHYQETLAEAQQAGATPLAGRALYEIDQAAVQEQERILNDANLTAEQKERELKQVEQQQQTARANLLGKEPPAEAPAPRPPPPQMPHVIASGQNLAGLSLFYGVGMSDIVQANPDVDFRNLKPGQTVKIPQPPNPGPVFRSTLAR